MSFGLGLVWVNSVLIDLLVSDVFRRWLTRIRVYIRLESRQGKFVALFPESLKVFRYFSMLSGYDHQVMLGFLLVCWSEIKAWWLLRYWRPDRRVFLWLGKFFILQLLLIFVTISWWNILLGITAHWAFQFMILLWDRGHFACVVLLGFAVLDDFEIVQLISPVDPLFFMLKVVGKLF